MGGKLLSKLFGGINANATQLNIADNEAASIINWDIGQDGALTRRLGCSQLASLGTPLCHLGKFNAEDGTEYFVAVANYKIYRSTNLTNWTDITGSVSVTATGGYVGCAYRNKYFIANGVDAPFWIGSTGNSDTIESTSLLTAPATCNASIVGTAGTQVAGYAVSAVTPRGETPTSGVSILPTVLTTMGGTGFTSINHNLVTWVPVPGATAHRIYCAAMAVAQNRNAVIVPQGTLVLVGEVDGNTGSYDDEINAFSFNAQGALVYAPTTNSAYLTPNDWNVNGQPEGFVVIARGRDERMLAWRDNTIWASGLGDPFNWMTADDAFIWTIQAARDNRITSIGNLFDYTIVFTKTDAFLYSGASAGTISLEKTVPVGCASHNSIVGVGDDLYFWSQYGPTTMKRVVSGSDIQNTMAFNYRVRPLVFDTNHDQWQAITGYSIADKSRVVWWIPGSGQTHNTYGLVYQYDVGGWSSYDSWTPVSTVITVDGTIYAGFNDGTIQHLHTGYSDNGSAITATYTTGNMDLNNWEPRKRIPWVDIVADRTSGNYTFSVDWNFDMARQSWGPVVCTETTTGGSTVVNTSATTTQHRIFTSGIGNTIQLTFTANTEGQNVKIVGYGTEVRPLGKR